MNTTSKYGLGLAAYPINYLIGLQDRHIPVRKLRDQSILRYFNLNDPNSYLPLHVIYDFFEGVREHYGFEFFEPRYLRHYNFSNMGVCGKFMASADRVLLALQYVAKYGNLLCTNQNIQLEVMGPNVVCSNRFIGNKGFGTNMLEYIWLLMLLDILKNAEGDEYRPKEIHLKGKECDYPKLEREIGATAVRFNQEHSSVLFKTSTLAKPINSTKKLDVTQIQLRSPATSLSEKIERIFEILSNTGLPSMELISQFFGVSVSTLKRHLAAEKTSYHEITERWRFMKGIMLLTETNLKIKEISDCLYYANSANFIQAFRRWSGQSPKEFREAG